MQGQTNQMKATPAIYVHVIYSCNSHFHWLASTPSCRRRPVSIVNTCLDTVHAKTVLNVGCAWFAWVSHIECCKCGDYSIVVMSMLVCQSECNHKIDITGSGFTFNYYDSVPYETTPSDSKLALISFDCVSILQEWGKRILFKTPGKPLAF